MFRALLLPALLAFTLAHAQPDTLRVLFLGNSYTAANDLPAQVAGLAASAGHVLVHQAVTPGGHTLDGHSTNPTSLGLIMQGGWDHVVLQEQSQLPTIPYYQVNSMYPGARRLQDSIHLYDPCANVLFYLTWGRRFGGMQCDGGMVHCSPDFADFGHMQDSLTAAYLGIANELHAQVAPVGEAWRHALQDTTLVLHTADNSHPNVAGTYLAACTFHAALWDESPVGLGYDPGLPAAQRTVLQASADAVVFDPDAEWGLELDRPVAGFSYVVNGGTVEVTDTSLAPATSIYTWDFGDGAMATGPTATHTYSGTGTYTVALVVSACGRMDSVMQEVAITTLGLAEREGLSEILPAVVFTDVLPVEAQEAVRAELLTVEGRVVASTRLRPGRNTWSPGSDLPAALYTLRTLTATGAVERWQRVVKER